MSQQPRVAVKAIIENCGEILLVQQRTKSGGMTWDLPGGGIEHGSLALDTLRRELREELTLVEPDHMLVRDAVGYMELYRASDDFALVALLHRVVCFDRNAIQVPTAEQGKILGFVWVDPREAKRRLVADGYHFQVDPFALAPR